MSPRMSPAVISPHMSPAVISPHMSPLGTRPCSVSSPLLWDSNLLTGLSALQMAAERRHVFTSSDHMLLLTEDPSEGARRP
ncbi:hypothetical protein CgunFtcFv8_018304 [Champsocephalus gunnari]|uniref:Uncharacterized protein n=1 Tax=Champsocephalus gunnari TaxID=52237 RepID=A0AAN8GUN8_CHAGU|nr:hypothetical protein CgunFtcFv8_018304 [Champsocephalus gunnari]